MKTCLLEPLGVSRELIEELSAPIREAGHEFIAYDRKTTDSGELAARAQGCEAVMIANNPFPDEVIRQCPELKMINVAFTGIDHVGQSACREQGILICNAMRSGIRFGPEAYPQSLELGRLYRKIAERYHCGFIDCGELGFEINTVDGLHYSRADHARLAQSAAAKIREMLA